MKFFRSIFRPKEVIATAIADSSSPGIERRRIVAGVGVAGAAGLAAAALYRPGAVAPPAAVIEPPHDADGYRETRHVLRYYETTRS